MYAPFVATQVVRRPMCLILAHPRRTETDGEGSGSGYGVRIERVKVLSAVFDAVAVA